MNQKQTKPFDAATTVEHSPEAKPAPGSLAIDSGLMDRIVRHLRDWLPNEGCGLLAGVCESGRTRAVHFFPGSNIDYSPVRYTMDPVEVVAAMKRMREENWQLVAIAHSHPRTPPAPSRTDQAEWYYPEARLLIVSFAGDEPEFGCWESTHDQETLSFRAAALHIEKR